MIIVSTEDRRGTMVQAFQHATTNGAIRSGGLFLVPMKPAKRAQCDHDNKNRRALNINGNALAKPIGNAVTQPDDSTTSGDTLFKHQYKK